MGNSPSLALILLSIKMKHGTKNSIKPKQSETKYTMVKNKDEVLTTDEAIQYLKISRPTYFKCIHLGKINAIKVGSGWRILQSELNRFLKSGMRNRKERLTATR
jgi:excisionase family DNA binding protein